LILVKLLEDINRDLILQPSGDRLLAKGRFNATGNATLTFTLQFVVGSTKTLFLSYDIAPDAVVGDLVGARIPAPSAISILGTADGVAPGTFPVGTLTASRVQPGPPPAIRS